MSPAEKPTAGFYARKQLLLSARLSHRNSVPLSICLSHGWISQKRYQTFTIGCLENFSFTVSGTVKLFHKFEGGNPERGC